jgi:hypothetical protein
LPPQECILHYALRAQGDHPPFFLPKIST